MRTLVPNIALNRMDPTGTAARAAIGELSAEKAHEIYGASFTAAERTRADKFIPADGDDLAEYLHNEVFGGAGGIVDKMKGMNVDTWEVQGVKMQWIYPVRYTATFTNDTAGSGTIVDIPLPQNVASTMTKKAVIAGRSSIGSLHFAGLANESADNGFLTPARIVAMTSIGNDLIVPLDTGVIPNTTLLRPVIYHKALPDLSQPFTDFIVQPTVRVMRRRTVGLGV